MSKHYILIGASAASFGALNSLSKFDPDASVTLISAEAELPYNKCKLADYLAGIIDQKELYLAATAAKKNTAFILAQKVTGIDSKTKTVSTDVGQSFVYDALFLGMGSSPFIPKIPGVNYHGIFTFHTNKDASDILDYVKKNSVQKVAVIGAGLSGLEAADALIKHNLRVTIIEKNTQVLPSMLSAEGALFLQSKITELSATLLLNASVQEIVGVNQKVAGVMVDGEHIDADMVIIATGLKPNLELCHQAGIMTDEYGVIVNEHLQTNISDIYAGGDLIGVYDQLTCKRVRSCLWPDAMQQGMHAGMAMAGKPKAYGGTSVVTSTSFFGMKYARAGTLDLGDQIIKKTSDFHHMFALDQGMLTGFQVLGNVHNLGLLRRTILTRQPISSHQLDFE